MCDDADTNGVVRLRSPETTHLRGLTRGATTPRQGGSKLRRSETCSISAMAGRPRRARQQEAREKAVKPTVASTPSDEVKSGERSSDMRQVAEDLSMGEGLCKE